MTDTTPSEFSTSDTITALRQTLAWAEAVYGKAQQGYFSGEGWAARCLRAHLLELQARAASQPAQEPDNDKVICPNCCHQFRAIPVNVQQILLNLGCEPPFMGTPEPAQQAEPVALEHLCGVLPAETYWGDPITPDVVRHILSVGPPYAAPPVTQQAEPVGEKRIANAIHYPACWDTAAYPELDDALAELFQAFKCQECAPADDEAVRLLKRAIPHVTDSVGANATELRAAIDAYLAKARQSSA